MANIKQQKKRNRQNERKRIKNSQVKSSIRTATKKVINAIEAKEGKDVAAIEENYKIFIKAMDTAAGKGIFKKSTAGRKKSRLSKKVNAALAETKTA